MPDDGGLAATLGVSPANDAVPPEEPRSSSEASRLLEVCPLEVGQGPLRPLGIDVADERERPRLGGCGADSHHGPSGDEDPRGGSDRRG